MRGGFFLGVLGALDLVVDGERRVTVAGEEHDPDDLACVAEPGAADDAFAGELRAGVGVIRRSPELHDRLALSEHRSRSSVDQSFERAWFQIAGFNCPIT